MGLITKKDNWRIPDKLWEKIEPLLPPRKPHPLGCHRPRVPDKNAMTAILFILRTGCHWDALDGTGICSHSSAHRRFQEWAKAGVFKKMWEKGLIEYNNLRGINWKWLSLDGAITKSPLGGEKNRSKPNRQSKKRNKKESIN